MSRQLIRIVTVGLGLALACAAVAFADLGGNSKVWCAGNICVTDDGGIAPSKLPRHGKAPVTARLNGEIETRDGTHPPALETIDLEIDKTIGIDAIGLPTCKAGQLQSRDTATASYRPCCTDVSVTVKAGER